jgi:DNA polymerase-4
MRLRSPDRAILHLDADAFFASVEQRDDPRLRGRPVAVGTGVVASCSYESRRSGVRTGMPLGEARRLCPRLLVIPGDYRRYEQAARRMLAICLDQTPMVEPAALDDLYLDLTPRPGIDPDVVAGRLRAQIREEVGLGISVGVGTNKLVARVATKEAKPGRQVRVPAGHERDYLAPWSVRVLPGMGRKAGERLERINVRRVGEVAAMPVPILRGLFCRQGRVLHDQSHGIDPRPVDPHRPQQSVSRRASFDPPTGDPGFLGGMLDYLLERAASWLRFQNLAARGLLLTIRYGDYESADGRVTFRRLTQDDRELREAARDRLLTLYHRRLPLRLLGIELAPLAPPDGQATLFPDPEEERAKRLRECKDAIRLRFGFLSLVSGTSLELAARLPHDRDHFELRTPSLCR